MKGRSARELNTCDVSFIKPITSVVGPNLMKEEPLKPNYLTLVLSHLSTVTQLLPEFWGASRGMLWFQFVLIKTSCGAKVLVQIGGTCRWQLGPKDFFVDGIGAQ